MPKVLHPGYFPFCLETINRPGPQFSLAQAMEFYWRVKIWRISINFVCTVPFYPDEIFLETFDLAIGSGEGRGGIEWASGVPAPNEESLVCPPGTSWGWDPAEPLGDKLIAFGVSGVRGSFTCVIGLPVQVGLKYVFEIYVFATAGAANASLPSDIWDTWPNVAVCGDFSVTLPSGLISHPIYCGYQEGYFTVLSISMSPLQYWSYDGTYDTVTGAPL